MERGFINISMPQHDRLIELNKIAIQQMKGNCLHYPDVEHHRQVHFQLPER